MPRTLPIVNATGEVPVVEAFQDAIMEFFLGTTTVDSSLAHSRARKRAKKTRKGRAWMAELKDGSGHI